MPQQNDFVLAEMCKKLNLTAFTAKIKWTFSYGVFYGTIKDSANAVSILGKEDCGEFTTLNVGATGRQEITISWYREEGNIKFQVLNITKPF